MRRRGRRGRERECDGGGGGGHTGWGMVGIVPQAGVW